MRVCYRTGSRQKSLWWWRARLALGQQAGRNQTIPLVLSRSRDRKENHCVAPNRDEKWVLIEKKRKADWTLGRQCSRAHGSPPLGATWQLRNFTYFTSPPQLSFPAIHLRAPLNSRKIEWDSSSRTERGQKHIVRNRQVQAPWRDRITPPTSSYQ